MRGYSRVLLLSALAIATLTFLVAPVLSQQNGVLLVRIDGTITTSMHILVEEAVNFAEANGYGTIIILLNTLGGQLDSTMKIVDTIERSSIPVIVYVYPSGAKAWSAGTFILMASHVAAMAPHTVTGSCQPVSYSPLGTSEPITDEKTINAITAYLVERARMHGRNETAARLFVLENLNINEEMALKYGVIEVVASSIEELLAKVDGMSVVTSKGVVKISTKDARVDEYEPSLRVQLLNYMSDPIIAAVAFLVGLYALIYGIAAPGHFAEVVGAILLLIGLLGLGLSVDLVALLFLLLGTILMIAEAYTPGFGLLGGAGFVSIIVGSILLIPFGNARWLVSQDVYNTLLAFVLAISTIVGGFTVFMVYKVVKAKRRRPVAWDPVGELAQVVDEIRPGSTGFVKCRGEYWLARSEEHLKPGDKTRIVGKEGHLLIVKPEGEG